MGIKLLDENIDWDFKRALKPEGALIPVTSHGKNSVVKVYMKKVPRYYHRITVDVDGTGYKISEEGRKALKKMVVDYDGPDVRESKRNFVNTYVLDTEVQRSGDSTEGEGMFLYKLMLLLEKDENLEDLVKPHKT